MRTDFLSHLSMFSFHFAIKKILQNTIEEEDKKKPLPDDQLAEILKEKGYPIARRTIAKYREQLDIPVARMRKKM